MKKGELKAEQMAKMLPKRASTSYKGQNGHVLVVAGCHQMPGAAFLASVGALRAGAGLVTVASIDSVCRIVASQLPEVTFLCLPEKNGTIAPDAAEVLLEKKTHYQSALFGPGLSDHENIFKMLGQVFRSWDIPSCLDADVLNAVSQGILLPEIASVLTPHPGEMGRLLKLSVSEVQADRFGSIQRAVEKYNQTFILKGAQSLVFGPSLETMFINPTGNAGMATGGMGDVLGGVVAALLGQGLLADEAAACGMYWHGLSGDLCAKGVGTIGYKASEVANFLPQARTELLKTLIPTHRFV